MRQVITVGTLPKWKTMKGALYVYAHLGEGYVCGVRKVKMNFD